MKCPPGKYFEVTGVRVDIRVRNEVGKMFIKNLNKSQKKKTF